MENSLQKTDHRTSDLSGVTPHSGLYSVLNVTKKTQERDENEMVIIDHYMSIIDLSVRNRPNVDRRIVNKEPVSASETGNQSRIHLYS